MRTFYAAIAFVFIVVFSVTSFAAENGNTNYKAKYERQIGVNRGMIATDAMIFTWFKQHNDYKKYQSIADKVKYLYDELDKAKEAHKNAKEFAAKQNWEKAYKFSKQEWEHLNNIAVKGKKAQDNLKELEGE